MKTFLVTGLAWQYLLFTKITMRAFIVVSSSSKFCHGTTIVLLSANPAFHQIHHHFRITVKIFLYLINFVWMFTFKIACSFHVMHNWQGRLFPPHGSHLLTSLISERAALTKSHFKFLLFLKPIIGISGNTFLWPSSQARITCSFFSWLFRCRNTGKYVTLNVSLLWFPWHFSLSNNSFLGIFLARSISFCTSLELYPLSKRKFSKSLQRLSKAWLFGIPFLKWKGWHKLDCKYWWLFAGLTYQSVSITDSARDTVTSKKLMEVFDDSTVNLMVGGTLLIL